MATGKQIAEMPTAGLGQLEQSLLRLKRQFTLKLTDIDLSKPQQVRQHAQTQQTHPDCLCGTSCFHIFLFIFSLIVFLRISPDIGVFKPSLNLPSDRIDRKMDKVLLMEDPNLTKTGLFLHLSQT